jgi:replication factor C large subunit
MADWTEKYRPTTLSEVRGNDKARGKLKEWADTWDDHREAVILHGSPGVGKTSAAHALASDLGWDVMELNASDSRTGDVIDRVAGEAAQTSTLSQAVQGDPNRRLIVMDEADNVHGNADRGGTRAITRIVKDASQPVVLIANDYYGMSNGLRNACQDVEFRDVSARSIVPALRDVCRKEGIEFEEDALKAIAEQTSGDLRSAINDLQAIGEGREELTVEDVVTGERDRSTDIFDFLDTALKEGSAEEALKASYDVDETPDDLINWIEDNLPKDYAGEELADAYDRIAAADRWLGRVRATQEYSYWRYASDNMTAGVAAARNDRKGGWTRWGAPSYWSKLGRSRSKRNERDDIARRIAEGSGTSIGTARHDVLPFLSAMTHHCKPRELTVEMAARYDFDESELSFVTGSGETTNKVQGIVEEARERREAATVEGTGDAFLPGEDEREVDGKTADEEADDAGGDDEDAGTLGDFGDDDGTADADTDGGSGDGESDPGSEGDPAEEAAEDEQQSGLGDFV